MSTEDEIYTQDGVAITPSADSKQSRSWLSYSSRMLFVVVSLCCIVLGWFSWRYDQAKREDQALEKVRSVIIDSYHHDKYRNDCVSQPIQDLVKIKYDFQFDRNGKFDPTAKHWAPTWLQGELGEKSLARVVSLELSTRYKYDDGSGVEWDDYTMCDFESLDFLLQFPNLRELTLEIGLKPDLDLSALGKLKKLRRLVFASPNIKKGPDRYSHRFIKTTLPLSVISNAKNLKELTIIGSFVESERRPCFQLNELVYSRHRLETSPCNGRELSLESFGDLSKLTQLKLSYSDKSFDLRATSGLPSLKRLSVSSSPLKNLDAFLDSPIEELRLTYCRELEDVSAITGSKTLRKLEVIGPWGTSYTGLGKVEINSKSLRFPALEEAGLFSHKGIEFLNDSPRFKKLVLGYYDANDLTVLERLSEIQVTKQHFAGTESWIKWWPWIY